MRSGREDDARRAVGLGRGPDAVERVRDEEHGDDGHERSRYHLLVAVVRRQLRVARFAKFLFALSGAGCRCRRWRDGGCKKSGAWNGKVVLVQTLEAVVDLLDVVNEGNWGLSIKWSFCCCWKILLIAKALAYSFADSKIQGCLICK